MAPSQRYTHRQLGPKRPCCQPSVHQGVEDRYQSGSWSEELTTAAKSTNFISRPSHDGDRPFCSCHTLHDISSRLLVFQTKYFVSCASRRFTILFGSFLPLRNPTHMQSYQRCVCVCCAKNRDRVPKDG